MLNARPLRAAASPRSTAESAAKCCRAPQRREALPGAAWIHGYMWILTNVQYCGYCNTWIPRYCVYHIIAHTCTGPVLRIPDTVLRIPDTHAPSSSTRPRVQPYTAHHSLTSSDPLLQLHTKSAGCTAKSALPHPFPLTNIGHACPSRLIAETYTSHDHSLTVLLTLESCSSRVTVSISGGKVTPNVAYNTLF